MRKSMQHRCGRDWILVLLVCTIGLPAAGFEATKVETTAFLTADKNKDLILNFNEFVGFVNHMADAGQKTSRAVRLFGAYKRAFRVTDRNQDGAVTPQELRRADDDYQAGRIPPE